MDDAASGARPAPPVVETAWPLPVQMATIALAGVAGALLLVQFCDSRSGGARPADAEEINQPADRLDLNTADAAELTQLPGLGPKLAEHIVTYREKHGPFARVEDLGRVPGVGAALLVRVRGWLVVPGPDAAEPPPPDAPLATGRASRPKQPLAGLVDLNTAPEEQLRTLPGVGEKTARALVEERARRPFASVDDLGRVRGLGVKTRDKLRPHVTVTQPGQDQDAR